MPGKKRRLEDLYVLGREATVDDGKGEVVVWLQKITPLEHEKAIRRASAEKAKVLMVQHDPESEEYLAIYSDVSDIGDRDALVTYVIGDTLAEIADAREAELAAEDEWSKDDYLAGLRDAWEGDDERPGLKDVWIENHDDPEAARVYGELSRFNDEVNKLIEGQTQALMADYKDADDKKLIDLAVARFIKIRSQIVWVREFRRSEVLYATREPDDHDAYYFALPNGKPDRDAVDKLAPIVFGQLSQAYQDMSVEPAEGKDLPPAATSSGSSGSGSEEETSVPSGPPAATP